TTTSIPTTTRATTTAIPTTTRATTTAIPTTTKATTTAIPTTTRATTTAIHTTTKATTTAATTTACLPLPSGVEPAAPNNLDRIDQPNRPLDGIYKYPITSGSGVNVYIVDTGINTANVEFGGRAILGPVFCSGCPNSDDHGYPFLISIRTRYGVAKQTTLISIKVCNSQGQCQNSDIITALTYIRNQHRSSSNKNTVINLSLGGGFSQILNDAVTAAVNDGIHVVVAAGNFAINACQTSPASTPEAITVAATDTSTDTIASFSNFGTCVNIFAPGTLITAAGNSGPASLLTFSGTSQATPHGTIALMIASGGNKSPAQMKIDLDNLSTKNVVL
ncbi:19020_t:CDS:2, partial [Racocetra persica]